MAHIIADRVRETHIQTSTTAARTLLGAVSGFQTMAAALTTNADTGWFFETMGADWQVFLGTRTSATVLTITTVLASSNGGAAVNWGTGVKDLTGTVPARFAELLNMMEVAVASATTTDIGAINGARIEITGTTTITGFGTSTHKLRFVRFSGALILTHNATSLILPGGANITTAAGDTAVFASDGSGNWRCLHYSRAAVPPRYQPLQTVISPFGQVLTSLTGTVPYDNTIPQNTEGNEIVTLAITPASTSNILEITAQVFYATTTANAMVMMLFQDATANALATSIVLQGSSGNMMLIKLFWRMAAGTTSATTFKIRMGTTGASDTTINGSGGSGLMGGTFNSYLMIKEFAP